MSVDARRIRYQNQLEMKDVGPVVYWMQRDQRAIDNWALLYAQEQALSRQQPLWVVFNLVPSFGDTTLRHYDFMTKGLSEVEKELGRYNIPFFILVGDPVSTIPKWVTKQSVSLVVTDNNPLDFTTSWRTEVADKIAVPLVEVDAHNVIPVWQVSDKQEFAAHTFRPKVHRLLPEYLVAFPKLTVHQYNQAVELQNASWEELLENQSIDKTVAPVTWCTPGTEAGMEVLHSFIGSRGVGYAENRNDPNASALSNLSSYLHFGQISAQRAAMMVKQSDLPDDDKAAFLEELIVRRELADNFCFYNKQYDKLSGAHAWAQKTLQEHRDDQREYIYTKEQFETATTHDELWNAMQIQLLTEGKIHGWCRMYWAKKILEWTNTPEYAIKVALYLNDKYSLDGTDPNGVVGVMWSIAGVHDRAWTERPVFGKIRFMNFSGAKRKFDVAQYIARYDKQSTTLFE